MPGLIGAVRIPVFTFWTRPACRGSFQAPPPLPLVASPSPVNTGRSLVAGGGAGGGGGGSPLRRADFAGGAEPPAAVKEPRPAVPEVSLPPGVIDALAAAERGWAPLGFRACSSSFASASFFSSAWISASAVGSSFLINERMHASLSATFASVHGLTSGLVKNSLTVAGSNNLMPSSVASLTGNSDKSFSIATLSFSQSARPLRRASAALIGSSGG
mmetsp:Transcript_94387/g.266552  ORF Transcript_94387/g.266552 Transcript_94387/m.266552 type:complete len:216 (-) Transcript_94387:685-1332(-)